MGKTLKKVLKCTGITLFFVLVFIAIAILCDLFPIFAEGLVFTISIAAIFVTVWVILGN